MTVMETLAAMKEAATVPASAVLTMLQRFLEEELVPVIQSDVNGELREVQTNNALFALPPPLMPPAEVKSGTGAGAGVGAGVAAQARGMFACLRALAAMRVPRSSSSVASPAL